MPGRTREEIRAETDEQREQLLAYAEELESGEYHSRELLYYPILDAGVAGAWGDDADYAAHEAREQIENASPAQVAAYHAYATITLEM